MLNQVRVLRIDKSETSVGLCTAAPSLSSILLEGRGDCTLPKHFYFEMVLFSVFLLKSSVFNLRISSFRITLGRFWHFESFD